DEHLETAKGHLQSCEASFAGNNTAPLGKQAHACDEILGAVLAQSTANNGRNNCVNYYDIRLADSSCGQQWPAPLEHVTAYLNLFPEILAEIPVLLFAGDQDLICNYEGIEQMISRISWNGGTGFANEDRELLWKVGPAGGTAEPAGTYRTARNLTYVKIFNASHMVAWDKPAEAMDMIHRFVGLGGGVGVQSWIEGEPDVPASPTGPPLTEIPPDAAEKSATVPWALLR
ncbi:MAG: Alpha/Beta hydrolase protein, partial [Olpidium bornovanus]